jgi:hypothetical protein
VAAVDAVQAGHTLWSDLAAKGKDVICVGAEFDVVPIDPALELAVLVRPRNFPEIWES